MSSGFKRKTLFYFTQFIWVHSSAVAMNDDCHNGFQFIAESTIRLVRNPDGTRGRIPGFARVTVFHEEGETSFQVTNRSLEHLRGNAAEAGAEHFYEPGQFFQRRILDIGSGDLGEFVRDLRNLGAEAYGVDLTASASGRYLVRGNAGSLPFASDSFDLVYSHFSVFSAIYSNAENYSLRAAAFAEAIRVLRPMGRLRIGPNPGRSRADIESLMQNHPNVILREFQGVKGNFFEITRIR